MTQLVLFNIIKTNKQLNKIKQNEHYYRIFNGIEILFLREKSEKRFFNRKIDGRQNEKNWPSHFVIV